MANKKVYNSTDAAGIEPKFVPNFNLLPRDDSGGPDWDPYTASFGDGKDKRGEKPHLSADGSGSEDAMGNNDERSRAPREKNESGDLSNTARPRKEQME